MKTVIGDFEFPTKKAAIEHVRKILWSYRPGTRLVGDDAELITALAGLHPRAEEKIGVGIDHISVQTIDRGAPGFRIKRLDGSADDLGHKRPFEGDLSHRNRVLKAMRRSVEHQIQSFRRTQFAAHPVWQCAHTGNLLRNDPLTHVDHVNPTFAELAEEYAASVGGFDAIAVTSSPTHPGPALVEHHRIQFELFHDQRKCLQLVHHSANTARARKPR